MVRENINLTPEPTIVDKELLQTPATSTILNRMNILNREVKHPWWAFGVIFTIGALLSQYGVIDGSLYLFDLLAGVLIYKLITSKTNLD